MSKILSALVVIAALALASAPGGAGTRAPAMEDLWGNPTDEYGLDDEWGACGRVVIRNLRGETAYVLSDWSPTAGYVWAAIPSGKRVIVKRGYARSWHEADASVYHSAEDRYGRPFYADASDAVYLHRRAKKSGQEANLLPRRWKITIR